MSKQEKEKKVYPMFSTNSELYDHRTNAVSVTSVC